MMNKKTILITGASSGLGKYLSYSFVKEGWKVIGIARSKSDLLEIKESLGENFDFFICDITNYNEVKKISLKLKISKIIPKIIILNAGIFEKEDNNSFNINMHETLFRVNYFGSIYFIKEWLSNVLENEGIIVSISSLLAKQAAPYAGAYCASKAAIAKLFDSLRIQYKNSKASFVTVYAGPMKEATNKSNIPLTTNYNLASEYIMRKIMKGKENISFPFIYSFLLSLSCIIPKIFLNYIYNFFYKKLNK